MKPATNNASSTAIARFRKDVQCVGAMSRRRWTIGLPTPTYSWTEEETNNRITVRWERDNARKAWVRYETVIRSDGEVLLKDFAYHFFDPSK